MINLLPPDLKGNLIFARKNAQLLRYCNLMLAVILGMVAITVIGIFFLQSSKNAYVKQIAQTKQSLQGQNIEEVQKKAEEMSGNIKLTTDVLSREILFSKLLKQIGSVMPANTSLSDLKISNSESGISLTAIASNYNSASQVQVNLSDPANKIFEKADIVSINCDKSATDRYPCTVIIRALFGDNKSYLFINPSKANSKDGS